MKALAVHDTLNLVLLAARRVSSSMMLRAEFTRCRREVRYTPDVEEFRILSAAAAHYRAKACSANTASGFSPRCGKPLARQKPTVWAAGIG